MDRDSWDRLSPGERDVLILNAIFNNGVYSTAYSYHDNQLWASIRGGAESVSNWSPSSKPDFSTIEYDLKHRGLGDKYIRELCHMLIGFSPNTVQFEDLWPLVTATPSERCLAAYNVLEESK